MKNYALLLILFVVPSPSQLHAALLNKVTVGQGKALDSLALVLHFSGAVASRLKAESTVKHHGTIRFSPPSEWNPFRLGFDFSTSIFSDPEFLRLEPKT